MHVLCKSLSSVCDSDSTCPLVLRKSEGGQAQLIFLEVAELLCLKGSVRTSSGTLPAQGTTDPLKTPGLFYN